MKNKWHCEECGYVHKTKRELVEDLKQHFEEASQTMDYCSGTLEDLGIKNPFK